MQTRNIINLSEVRAFLEELILSNPTLSSYIKTKVMKFLKNDTYLVERSGYALWLKGKIILGVANSFERKIYRNYGWRGPYQVVPCEQGLAQRIQAGLDFLKENKVSRNTPFKEVLYEMDRFKLGIKTQLKRELSLNVDYSVVAIVGAFEVWELLTPLAYEEEGLLMKNCIGKSEKQISSVSLYSVRYSKDKKPIINIKVEKDRKLILEAKEKVNQEIKQYLAVYQKVKRELNLQEKVISDYFLSIL